MTKTGLWSKQKKKVDFNLLVPLNWVVISTVSIWVDDDNNKCDPIDFISSVILIDFDLTLINIHLCIPFF